MPEDESVTMPLDQQWMVHGQVGNIFAKCAYFRRVLNGDGLSKYVVFIDEIETEAEFLKKYLPPQPAPKLE